MKLSKLNRLTHRWASTIANADHDHHRVRHCPALEADFTLLPAAYTSSRLHFQPPTQRRVRTSPATGVDRIIEIVTSVPEGWEILSRYCPTGRKRPPAHGQRIGKVRCKNRYEIQHVLYLAGHFLTASQRPALSGAASHLRDKINVFRVRNASF